MTIYLISNNLLCDSLNYTWDADLDTLRKIRVLSIEGERVAQKISELKILEDTDKIISSFQSSALGSAKYLNAKLDLTIDMHKEVNDCKVGELGSKNMKMVKGLQDHEFTYKLPGGESLIDVGNRLDNFIKSINNKQKIVIYTHKRAILGFILKYCQVGYNLDENLILTYNNNVIYDDSESNYDIYELTMNEQKILDIKRIIVD